MKINEFRSVSKANAETKALNVKKTESAFRFEKGIKMKPASRKGVKLERSTADHEIVKNYSEWYLKMGGLHEKTKDYKQAVSAYEKAYAVKPDVNTAQSLDRAKSKDFLNQ